MGLFDFFSDAADEVGGLFDSVSSGVSDLFGDSSDGTDTASTDTTDSSASSTSSTSGGSVLSGIGSALKAVSGATKSNSSLMSPRTNYNSPQIWNAAATTNKIAENQGTPARAADATAIQQQWVSMMRQFANSGKPE